MTYKIPPTVAERQKEIEKLTKIEQFALDAYLISKLSPADKLITAYEISRAKDSTANRQSIYMLARKWINTQKCKYYLDQRRNELFNYEWKTKRQDQDTGKDNTDNANTDSAGSKRTKSETIEELNNLATNTNDPKLRAEILLKISDLEGWKKEQEIKEDDTIRYYLPLRCNVCPLYHSAKMSQSKK